MIAMVGNILGNRYEVLERIGTGGMSLVYRARDITLNRLVAVKILKHQWAEDEEVVRRFDQEARAAASLVDRHIVQVYDVGRDEPDVHYMVMELVAGETLRAKINRDAPLDVKAALEIADQVAEGLEVAHAKRLVHRDIKPQNVLIATDGTVKVTDFGIAYAATTGTLVNTGSLLGTVQYLSPEQARGKLIGPQSDLYSLGVVLFEMLTGSLPFESDSAIGVAIKHLQDEPPRVDALRPDIPSEVAHIVERALSKDPAERYQSAHALRQDIGRILDPEKFPEGGAVTPAVAGRRSEAKSTKRKWWIWAILAAIVLLVVGGGLYAFNRWLNPPVVAVPNIRGRSVAEARTLLSHQGLTLTIDGHAPSSAVPANYVLTESPSPGSRVKSGLPITVVLSSGPTKVSVPPVTKEDVYSARQSLSVLGLKARVKHIASGKPNGYVVRQSPPAGRTVAENTTVTLYVSNGPKVAAAIMPNLTGLTVSNAASEMAGMSIAMGSPNTQYSTEPANTIIDQNPAPYSTLDGVSTIGVTVSNGPSPESATMQRNVSQVRFSIPSSAHTKSLLKVVVTDQAGNEEVLYEEVNPGQQVDYPVTWYGTTGEVTVSLNGQPGTPKALTATPPSTSSSPSAPSTSSSPPSSTPPSSTAPSTTSSPAVGH